MPRALAIETSSRVGSIALVDGERVLDERSFEHGLQHAAQIIPIIDALVRAQNWQPRDIEHLYVSAGPGSFTGLRIGVTLAKTMALATGVKLVAVPTVRVLVENAPPEARHIVLVLDAKRDQIFTARFERAGAAPSPGTRVGATPASSEPRMATQASPLREGEGLCIERESAHLDSLRAMLHRAPRPVHLLGEGIPFHEKFIPRDDASVIVTPAELWRPRAAVVGRIGYEMAQREDFADPDRLAPIYIRKPEAEEKWDAAQRSKATGAS